MATISFTANLERHVDCPDLSTAAHTVAEALERVFQDNPKLRGYVVDEQGKLRHHVVVFLNGTPIADRNGMSDAIADTDEVFVFQALSGG